MKPFKIVETEESPMYFNFNLDHDFGIYKYPDGTIYEGQFKDGAFHGYGVFVTSSNFKVSGNFVNGKSSNLTLEFPDGLKYDTDHWKYLTNLDRRYMKELNAGLEPVGNSYIFKDKKTRKIPDGCYDVDEGYFNPKNGAIYAFETNNYIRNVTKTEWNWILKNAYKKGKRNVGFKELIVRDNEMLIKEVNDILNCCNEIDVEMPIEYK